MPNGPGKTKKIEDEEETLEDTKLKK